MAYVYKYTDKNDGVVKYVGIIRKESNFPKRFQQHKSDSWANDGDWEISYIEVSSTTDAEALEGHFITLYETDSYYNKSKSTWGVCSFAPENLTWKVWTGQGNKKSLLNTEAVLRADINKLMNDVMSLSNRLNYFEKDVQKEKRRSVRSWFRNTFYGLGLPKEYRQAYTIESCFEHYQSYSEWLSEHYDEELYEFDDFSDFLDCLYDCSDISCTIADGNLCGILQRKSELGEKYEEECTTKYLAAMDAFTANMSANQSGEQCNQIEVS